MYQYYNANPKQRHTDDCVVRSLSLLTNKSWSEIYDELSDLANEDAYMIDSVAFVEDYLDDRYKRTCHYSKTLAEFVNEFPFGKYAVTMNGHITAVIDGVIFDTFDPSKRIIRCSWEIE